MRTPNQPSHPLNRLGSLIWQGRRTTRSGIRYRTTPLPPNLAFSDWLSRAEADLAEEHCCQSAEQTQFLFPHFFLFSFFCTSFFLPDGHVNTAGTSCAAKSKITFSRAACEHYDGMKTRLRRSVLEAQSAQIFIPDTMEGLRLQPLGSPTRMSFWVPLVKAPNSRNKGGGRWAPGIRLVYGPSLEGTHLCKWLQFYEFTQPHIAIELFKITFLFLLDYTNPQLYGPAKRNYSNLL